MAGDKATERDRQRLAGEHLPGPGRSLGLISKPRELMVCIMQKKEMVSVAWKTSTLHDHTDHTQLY